MTKPPATGHRSLPPLELVVVTGMSGAGRSTAARSLEDLGWFVVDNLPPSLIPAVAELATRSQGAVGQIAVVTDVRSRAFTTDLRATLSELDRLGLHPRLLFLEASDEALIRRFDSVRRPHPLQGDGTPASGIEAERELLRDIRGEADLVVDTSVLNIHELRAKITAMVGGVPSDRLVMTVMSFGYKWGLPPDADLVLDCRVLPNPHWVPELRPKTGLDDEVRDWVMEQHGAGELVGEFETLLRRYSEGYAVEGKHYATVAVGCTGGKHRSVTIAEELVRRLAANGVDVHVIHRDLGRE
jgi:UPF0042 nucleotide-binding protein